jgi:hypothetical protein
MLMQTQRIGTGLVLLVFNLGARRGLGGQCHAPVHIVEEAEWAPEIIWMGSENILLPPGFKPWTIQAIASPCTDYAISVPTHVY